MNEVKTKKAVVCQRCGCAYPPDYYEQWGRRYGRGLGPDPVCEALRSKYDRPFTVNPNAPGRAMFPLQVCKGVMVNQDVPIDTEMMVLGVNDRMYALRAPIMQKRQRAHSAALDAHLTSVETAAKKIKIVNW